MRPTPRRSTRGSKDARDLLEQAAAYEIGLGMELEEVKGKIQEAKSRIAERLLGKTALSHHPEDSALNHRLPSRLKRSTGPDQIIQVGN